MQLDAHHGEYRPLTEAGAARVTKEFGIEEQAHVLFKIVSAMTQSYERYKLTPNDQQMKDALSKLSAAIGEAASITRRHRRQLQPPLEGSLLRQLGELLTYEALEKLTGKPVVRTGFVAMRFQPPDPDEQSRIDRSFFAVEAGLQLLVALFEQMKQAVDDTIEKGRTNVGGRPIKHLHRRMIMYELARQHKWFFDKPPTSGTTGHFARFCRAVLDELRCDMTGFNKAVPQALKGIGIFGGRRPPRLTGGSPK